MTRANIAIDGPAGAGKSTVAKKLAAELGFTYIDTGAMYRALTWKVLQEQADPENEQAVLDILQNMQLGLDMKNSSVFVTVDRVDVTDAIREQDVTSLVSYTARHARIRTEMVEKQKELAASGGTVMDGRDIGTAVLPDASYKFFLNATVEERAKRRHAEQLSKGMDSDLTKLRYEIAERDRIDSERETAPLKKADDAIEVDTTAMTIDQVVAFLLDRVKGVEPNE
ncbi:(d)CMP kinase [Bacillus daqingensis]|uniref:Cytidylate kinase n=1 Tax=Bacillus daqingensis TaxID=872396 RepID=A0ABV9NZ83_9BACI